MQTFVIVRLEESVPEEIERIYASQLLVRVKISIHAIRTFRYLQQIIGNRHIVRSSTAGKFALVVFDGII